MQEKIIKNIKEMKKFAREFSKTLNGGEVILLNGDLGAGKTTFTQFVLENLGVDEPVSSPSFTIMKSYKTEKFNFYHFDMYRIEDESETYEIGFEDYIQNNPRDIVFIEWSERVLDLLDKTNCKTITIERIDENKRKVRID